MKARTSIASIAGRITQNVGSKGKLGGNLVLHGVARGRMIESYDRYSSLFQYLHPSCSIVEILGAFSTSSKEII